MAAGSWARGAEHEDDNWESPSSQRQRQRRRRLRALAVPTGDGADFAELDGGTGWDCLNGRAHDGDVWDDVPVVFVVPGSRAEVLGSAIASGKFPPPPVFSLTNSPFPVVVFDRNTPPIIPLRFSVTIPPPSSPAGRPSLTSPTAPFPDPPAPSQHLSSPPHDL